MIKRTINARKRTKTHERVKKTTNYKATRKRGKIMNFASAFISLQRGHKIRRKHWKGYWILENNEIMMHCYDGRVINIKDTDDILYTISNMACNDWEIADNYGATKEQ